MNNICVRFKSWGTWAAVLGAVGIILNSLGVFKKMGIDNEAWKEIVNAIGSILIAFGVLNNPTDCKKF